jgi:hypothetical protein
MHQLQGSLSSEFRQNNVGESVARQLSDEELWFRNTMRKRDLNNTITLIKITLQPA